MRDMFNGATAFNQPLGEWRVERVTDMRGMFFSARAFNQPLEGWGVGQGTDMRYMFDSASSLARRPAWYKQG